MKKKTKTKRKSTTEPAVLGRPTLYGPEVLVLTRKYIDESVDRYEATVVHLTGFAIEDDEDTPRTVQGPMEYQVNIPTLEGLAVLLHVHKDTIQEWRKQHEEFSVLTGELMHKQGQMLIKNGLNGKYNPTIAKLILTKHGYVDKQVIDDKRTMLGDVFDAAAKRRKELEAEE